MWEMSVFSVISSQWCGCSVPPHTVLQPNTFLYLHRRFAGLKTSLSEVTQCTLPSWPLKRQLENILPAYQYEPRLHNNTLRSLVVKGLVFSDFCKTNHLGGNRKGMLRNHMTHLEWPQDLMVYWKLIGQQGIHELKISHGKWILLTNEESMKSPGGFSMLGSSGQANSFSPTLRDLKKKKSKQNSILFRFGVPCVQNATVCCLAKVCSTVRGGWLSHTYVTFVEAYSKMLSWALITQSSVTTQYRFNWYVCQRNKTCFSSLFPLLF